MKSIMTLNTRHYKSHKKSLVLVKNIINGRYVRCSNKMQKSDFLYVSLIFEILKLPSTIPHDPL